MSEPWIKIYRKFLKWEWLDIPEMVALWIHLLLNANWKDETWHGIEVKRGQLITNRSKLSKSTGLSEQQIRTCLERLKLTNEITIKATSKYTIITICKYDDYQRVDDNEQPTEQPTEQQTSNQQSTTLKEIEEEKKENISKDILKKESPKDLESRKKDFYNSLVPFVATYGKQLIRNFYNYWAEEGNSIKTKGKMRWEMEKTWNLSMRLSKWSSNNYNNDSKPTCPTNKKITVGLEAIKALTQDN